MLTANQLLGVRAADIQAACSGMDCAVMSGGDVGPLGKDAVTELHGLFRWAAKSPRCVRQGTEIVETL